MQPPGSLPEDRQLHVKVYQHLDRRRAEGLNAHGRCRTNLDHFLVEAGDGFVRDALCADLPNLQKTREERWRTEEELLTMPRQVM
jgi:hypothetical protein